MEELKLNRQNFKKFGITMGFAFSIITLFILIRHRHSIWPTSCLSLIFFILGFLAPGILKPVYIFWMKLAFVLGWLSTRLILLIMFYLLFTPIGLCLRLCGVDLLNRRIEQDKESYWVKKEKKGFNTLDYERRF